MEFALKKLNNLASKPLTFDNWQEFRGAFLSQPSLPSCYDLPNFKNSQDFKLRLVFVLTGRAVKSGFGGRSVDFQILLERLKLWVENGYSENPISISDFLDYFPSFILV